MGAPLLAYVQNIVHEVRVCVSSWLVMCGGNAAHARVMQFTGSSELSVGDRVLVGGCG